MAASLCPCLFMRKQQQHIAYQPRYDEDSKLLEGDTLGERQYRRGSVRREQRGTWLDEGDELAQFCHKCNVQFTIGARHHCRRCGNTFCAACSSGRVQNERICDVCVPEAQSELEFQKRHLPLLDRGLTLGLKSLLSTEMVLLRLNAAGDGLEMTSSSTARSIRLADIDLIELNPLTIRSVDATFRFESPQPPVDFARALTAAVRHVQAPDLATTVHRQREALKLDKLRAAAIRQHDQQVAARRAANADLRNSLKHKYALGT